MNTDNLQDMINAIVIAKTEHFYKKNIVNYGGNNDYLSIEKYHKEYSNNEMWKLSWAYKEYQEWRDSDAYIKDITYIENEFWDNMLRGYDYQMDELIDMTDDDDDKSVFIKRLHDWESIKTKTEKMEFLSKEYDKKCYYPAFSNRWLYNYYELFEI
jgi:hypothetical protein